MRTTEDLLDGAGDGSEGDDGAVDGEKDAAELGGGEVHALAPVVDALGEDDNVIGSRDRFVDEFVPSEKLGWRGGAWDLGRRKAAASGRRDGAAESLAAGGRYNAGENGGGDDAVGEMARERGGRRGKAEREED